MQEEGDQMDPQIYLVLAPQNPLTVFDFVVSKKSATKLELSSAKLRKEISS